MNVWGYRALFGVFVLMLIGLWLPYQSNWWKADFSLQDALVLVVLWCLFSSRIRRQR